MLQIGKKLNFAVFGVILVVGLVVTLLQGVPALQRIGREVILGGTWLVLIGSIVWLGVLYKMGKLSEESVVFVIVLWGMILHGCYVLLSGLYERQHDEGVYTGIATVQVNPGHIGYIEYVYKFHKLPDMNPYQLFSYYHPPLHYVISGVWLIVLTSLGMAEEMAFENLQVLPLVYSGLFLWITYRILKRIGAEGKGLYAGLMLTALHPALTIMSGSVNNDMLSSVLLACCILATLRWLQDKSLKNLLLIALSIGFGMICKINTAIIAFPVGLLFLIDFVQVIRSKDKTAIKRSVLHYAAFGCVSAVIGLSWIVRNLVKFHVKPGISSATEASVMYTGDYSIWARAGLPAFADWHFSFPFHPLSGDAIHNVWVIMFQTSLFAEEYPTELAGLPILLCQIAYVLAIVSATASMVLFLCTQYRKWKISRTDTKTTGLEALFLSTGYLTFLLSFVVFALKYPYTCSSDFRYIVICLIFIATGLADSDRIYEEKSMAARLSRITRISVCITLLLTVLIYMTWKRW